MKNKAGVTTRGKSAGTAMAEAIIEMVHLMYQNNTAMSFLLGLVEKLQEHIKWRRLL
jgi:hypothetical protein